MSQQEFDYPELPYEGQRSELAHYEQRSEWQDEVPLGERPDAFRDYHLPGEKLVPSRSRRLALWNPVVFCALVAFIAGTLFGFTLSAIYPALHSLSFLQRGSQTNSAATVGSVPQQSFPVSGSLSLSIHDLAPGTIRIHTGDTGRVVVSEMVQSDTGTSTLPLQSDQQGNTLTLSITGKDMTGVVLDVTTPPDTSFNVQADSATINFVGSLDPNDSYLFTTQTGSISASIPADSAFRLSNVVDVGDFTNEFGSDLVGNSPRANVALLAYGGAVAIQKI